jgi:hypothetical protein
MTGLYHSSLMIFIFLGYLLTGFSKQNSGKSASPETVFPIVFLAIITIRFLLQPVMADRFYIAYYLVISIFVLKKLNMVLANKQAIEFENRHQIVISK